MGNAKCGKDRTFVAGRLSAHRRVLQQFVVTYRTMNGVGGKFTLRYLDANGFNADELPGGASAGC
jgi:hypothetical protein